LFSNPEKGTGFTSKKGLRPRMERRKVDRIYRIEKIYSKVRPATQ